MNRNLQLLFAIFAIVAAALWGCGGTPENGTSIQAVPDSANQDDSDPPDGQVQPDAGETEADPPDVNTPETGKDAKPEADAAHEAEASVPPDGGTDADAQNEAEASTEAGQETGPDQDAQAEADAGNDTPDSQPETGQDANTGYDAPPPPAEICNNGLDDDFDGKKDCLDPDCSSSKACQPDLCNGLDDNDNGIIDIDLPGNQCAGYANNYQSCIFHCNGVDLPGHQLCDTGNCQWYPCEKNVQNETNCNDGIDNDCNNLMDCSDFNCAGTVFCQPENCQNGVDDNGNGFADCSDPACSAMPYCTCPSPTLGTACSQIGSYSSCDSSKRCDCTGKWNLSSNVNAYNCTIQETCNGQDDDGDGLKDETFPCVQNTTVDCATSCGSIGKSYCDMQCLPHACAKPPEDCGDKVDNDCDGAKDCQDTDCSSKPECQEVCNGLDDNGNNVIDVDNPANECAGVANNVQNCPFNCNGVDVAGTHACSTTTCKWGTCAAPTKELDCGNGKDDDCDGYTDCQDPDCWSTPACPHNFGTCATPTQASPTTCSGWPTEAVPSGPVMLMNGCANGENDQHAVGGDYNHVRFLRYTGSWSEVTLPVSGEPNITPPDVACVGAGNAFATYNVNSSEGAFVRWSGSTWTRLVASSTNNLVLGAVWGTDANHVWFLGRSSTDQKDVHVYKWNGTTLIATPLPTFGEKAFWGEKMWGSSLTDVWISGHVYQVGGMGTYEAAILHWDGTSWARVPVYLGESKLYYIHGTSSCDVMASGYTGTGAQAKAVTIQRYGANWDVRQYAQFSYARSLVKLESFKTILQAREDLNPMCHIWMGLGQNSHDVSWSTLSNSAFVAPGPTWRVPGTSTVMMSDEGPTGLEIRRSTCQ